MKYEHFEHEADIGVRGFGKTLEEAFENGAKAMIQILSNLDVINDEKSISIEVDSEALDELFVEFLNEILFLIETEEMMFTDFEIKIKKKDKYYLTGKAFGEKRDLERHQLKTEVKAATFSNLKVEEKNGQWIAQCVVDV